MHEMTPCLPKMSNESIVAPSVSDRFISPGLFAKITMFKDEPCRPLYATKGHLLLLLSLNSQCPE